MTERGFFNPHDHRDPKDAIVSSIDRKAVRKTIEFPKRVKGLTILDIGSGASNTVRALRKKGANAYGLDLGYSDIEDLVNRADYYSRDRAFWREGREVGDRIFSPDHPFDSEETNRLSFTIDQRTLQIFLDDVRDKSNSSYIAGDAERLPFADNTVDFAFSHLALTAFLLGNFNAFNRSVSEALRVLKPGCELQLADWAADHLDEWTKKQRKNARTFLRSLENRGIPFAIEKTIGKALRLRIKKP